VEQFSISLWLNIGAEVMWICLLVHTWITKWIVTRRFVATSKWYEKLWVINTVYLKILQIHTLWLCIHCSCTYTLTRWSWRWCCQYCNSNSYILWHEFFIYVHELFSLNVELQCVLWMYVVYIQYMHPCVCIKWMICICVSKFGGSSDLVRSRLGEKVDYEMNREILHYLTVVWTHVTIEVN